MADLKKLAAAYARKHKVPVGIAYGLIQQESGWNPNARNPSGATGLMQIHLPSHPSISEKQALNPRFAIDWGLRYLKANHKRFGSWKLALAAYNAGPGNVENGRWQSFPETRNYVKSVLGTAGTVPKASKLAAPSAAAALPVPFPSPSVGAAPDFSQMALQNVTDIGSGRFDPVASLTNLTMGVAAQPPPMPAQSPLAAAPEPLNFGGFAPKPSKDWGGSRGVAQQLAQIGLGLGLTATSEKRDRRNTSSGNPSDHWTGSKDAYAFDLSNGSRPTAEMDAAAKKIAARLGVKWDGKSPLEIRKNVNGFRVQVLYRTNTGGNHHDHIHLGVRRIG